MFILFKNINYQNIHRILCSFAVCVDSQGIGCTCVYVCVLVLDVHVCVCWYYDVTCVCVCVLILDVHVYVCWLTERSSSQTRGRLHRRGHVEQWAGRWHDDTGAGGRGIWWDAPRPSLQFAWRRSRWAWREQGEQKPCVQGRWRLLIACWTVWTSVCLATSDMKITSLVDFWLSDCVETADLATVSFGRLATARLFEGIVHNCMLTMTEQLQLLLQHWDTVWLWFICSYLLFNV